MKFTRGDKIPYLHDTSVENIFICEYMLEAPGDYVKVFIFGLMLTDSGRSFSDEQIAKDLYMSEDNVRKAWLYWKEAGLVTEKDGDMVFVSVKEKLYGNGSGRSGSCPAANADSQTRQEMESSARNILDNGPLKKVFSAVEQSVGRPLNSTETSEILDWMETLNAAADVVICAYRYCADKGKTNVKYVGKVVLDWVGRGLATQKDVERYLGEEDIRYNTYRRIMKALGFHRGVTEEEKRLIDRWIDELGCTMDDILDACSRTSGISNPNINYVNKVISSRHEEKKSGNVRVHGVSRADVLRRYEQLRTRAERDARARREEVFAKVPRIREINDEKADLGSKLTQITISGGSDKLQKIEQLQAAARALDEERDRLLTENDIPVDYMNIKYSCRICQDTGTKNDGSTCECWMRVAEEVRQNK